MNRKITSLCLAAIVCASAGVGYFAHKSDAKEQKLSAVQLANIESLAFTESGDEFTCRWQIYKDIHENNLVSVCIDKGRGSICQCGKSE